MNEKLSEVHEALNCHEWIENGEYRRCNCGRVQTNRISRNYISYGWVDCSVFGKTVIDEDLYNVAISSIKGIKFW